MTDRNCLRKHFQHKYYKQLQSYNDDIEKPPAQLKIFCNLSAEKKEIFKSPKF